MRRESELDKSFKISYSYGTITIRVVVLEKSLASSAPISDVDTAPVDLLPDEILPDSDKKPTSTFLEEPKRGRQCCVFLINGQRQHAWDNTFIVRDLELKYLRNRMIVVVDCDGLRPEAIAHLMQGSRHQFFEGNVYSGLSSRVIATLKGDPDLRRLEEEAEDDVSSLQAGDEAVKATLDQLIEAHHDLAGHATEGAFSVGFREGGSDGGQSHHDHVVIESDTGVQAEGPVLGIRPDLATIRLKPNEVRRFTVHTKPEESLKELEGLTVTLDPPVKELQIARTTQLNGEEISFRFDEPDDFEEDEYPIETVLRCTALFVGHPEQRILERRVIVNRSKTNPPKPVVPLKDEPTFLRVTSRQPIKIVAGGADVHVKLRWDGKDELVLGNPPSWTFAWECDSPSVEPSAFLTSPVDGKFELLIRAVPGLVVGEQLKFDVQANGPGTTLSTSFLADVAEAVGPRKSKIKAGGAERRPPYELYYVTREEWDRETCWGQTTWTGIDPGAFDPPTGTSPLKIFINQDMDLLAQYRESLLSRKMAESTIQQRINRYTAHVGFHLYQMYQAAKLQEALEDGSPPSEDQQREEIKRVGRTLLKLMEVAAT